jgi:hypothetical protein
MDINGWGQCTENSDIHHKKVVGRAHPILRGKRLPRSAEFTLNVIEGPCSQ